MSRVQVVEPGLVSHLAQHVAWAVKTQDDFLSLAALGDFRATGQQKSHLSCWSSFRKDGGMPMVLYLLCISDDGCAIAAGNLRKGFEAQHRLDSPFENAIIEDRSSRSFLNGYSLLLCHCDGNCRAPGAKLPEFRKCWGTEYERVS